MFSPNTQLSLSYESAPFNSIDDSIEYCRGHPIQKLPRYGRKNASGPITRTEGVEDFKFAGQIANGLAVCHWLFASHFLVTGSDA